MKMLTLAVGLLVCSQCASAAWTKALELEEHTIFIDKDSIKKVENGYRLWSMTSFKRSPLTKGLPFQSYKVYEEYNCADSTYRVIHSIFFKGPNGTGTSETIATDNEAAVAAVPGQVSGEILRSLCKRQP